MTNFERERQELQERLERNVAMYKAEFNRHLKRYCIIAGAIILVLGIIQAVILVLLAGARK